MSLITRPLRDQSPGQLLAQGLGGDDVAPDGNDPTAKPPQGGWGVAVGGRQHFAGTQQAPAGPDLEARRHLPDAGDLGVLQQPGTRPLGGQPQPLDILGGLQGTSTRIQQRAMVAAGSDLPCPCPAAAEQLGLIAELLAQKPAALLQARAGDPALRPGSAAPQRAEVARDPLLGDQALQELHRVERQLEHPPGALRHLPCAPAPPSPACTPEGRSRRSCCWRPSPDGAARAG